MKYFETASSREILRLIRQHRHVPTPQLAKMTGLTLACVAKTVNDLASAGAIQEAGELRLKRRGRPSQVYQLQKNGAYALGLTIKYHQVEWILIDLLHHVVAQAVLPNHLRNAAAGPAGIEEIVRAGERLAGESVRSKLLGVAIALAGLFDDQRQEPVTTEDTLDRKQAHALQMALHSRLGVPVHFVNDVDASVIAERWAMAESAHPDSIIYVNDLLGFSILVDGRVNIASLFGSNRWLGRAAVQRDAQPIPPAFQGCLAQTASLWALCDQLAHSRFGMRTGPRTPQAVQAEVQQLYARFDAGDRQTHQVVERAFEDLAFVLRTLCILFGIKGIVLEGWSAPIRQRGIQIVQRILDQADYPGIDSQRLPPKVRSNSHGTQQQVLGAAISVIEHELGTPTANRQMFNRSRRLSGQRQVARSLSPTDAAMGSAVFS